MKFDKADFFSILLQDTDESFPCASDQTVLNAMVGLGRKGIPSGCHGGGCGICKVHVYEGEFSNLPMSKAHVSEDERIQGYALACRVYPKTDLSLKVVGKMQKAVVRFYDG